MSSAIIILRAHAEKIDELLGKRFLHIWNALMAAAPTPSNLRLISENSSITINLRQKFIEFWFENSRQNLWLDSK